MLTWTAPESDGGSPVLGYGVIVSPAVPSARVSITGTAAAISDLANGVEYTFRVYAINALGSGAVSDSSQPVRPGSCAARLDANYLVVKGERSLKESTVATLEAQAPEGSSVRWVQFDGPAMYLRPGTESTSVLQFIAPNVKADSRVAFEVSAVAASGATFCSVIAFVVEDVPMTPVIGPGLVTPNVFSDGSVSLSSSWKFDENGVLLNVVTGVGYDPTGIAKLANEYYAQLYLGLPSGQFDARRQVIASADWLRANCVYTKYGFCSWRSNLEFPEWHLTTDWVSAMDQGLAVSTLIDAASLTGDLSYLQVAFDAVSAFLYPLEEKGMVADFNGLPWYEEYGSVEAPTHVLNGFLFGMSGLYDAAKYLGWEHARHAWDAGVRSMEARGQEFSLGFTSKYDTTQFNIASAKGQALDAYHELHILQLGWFYSVTRSPVIRQLAEDFLMFDLRGLTDCYPASDPGSLAKVRTATAERSVDPVDHGPDRLFDGNWTWASYWSSYNFPVDLYVQLDDTVLTSGGLRGIMMASVSESGFPTSFDIYTRNPDGTLSLVKSNVSPATTPNRVFEYFSDGYGSHVVTFTFPERLNVGTQIVLRIHGAGDGVVALRELDVHFDRPELFKRTLGYSPFAPAPPL